MSERGSDLGGKRKNLSTLNFRFRFHPGEICLRMNETFLRTLLGTVSCCYWNFATAKTVYFVLAHLILMSYHLS